MSDYWNGFILGASIVGILSGSLMTYITNKIIDRAPPEHD